MPTRLEEVLVDDRDEDSSGFRSKAHHNMVKGLVKAGRVSQADFNARLKATKVPFEHLPFIDTHSEKWTPEIAIKEYVNKYGKLRAEGRTHTQAHLVAGLHSGLWLNAKTPRFPDPARKAETAARAMYAGANEPSAARAASSKPALRKVSSTKAEASSRARALIASAKTPKRDSVAAHKRGQGIMRDAKRKVAVEQRAVDLAIEHYEAAGWSVEDVGSRESYDLLCRKRGKDLHVEVKGTTGAGKRVFLTVNEVAHARREYPRVALFAVTGIVVSTGAEPEASGGVPVVFDPWDLEQERLKAQVYDYVLPDPPPLRARRRG